MGVLYYPISGKTTLRGQSKKGTGKIFKTLNISVCFFSAIIGGILLSSEF